MTAVMETERTWKIKAEVRKYHEDQGVTTVTRKRRNGKGLRGFCRPRLRYTEAVIPDGVVPREIVTSLHNLLANAGIQRLEDLLIVAGGQGFDATHSRVAAGDDATAAAASQTDLQAGAGATHRQFKLVSSGPTRSSQTITWVATFASGEGNFTAGWQEWCIDVGTADGTTVTAPMLNRKVAALGTKVAGAVWVFTVTLTIS